MTRLSRHALPAGLLPLVLATGCSDYGTMASDVGVTQGGSQDIGLAREIIEQGGIPTSEYFTSEGLFSEHDLPLDGEVCEEILCPRAAAAVVDPVDLSGEQMLVQLGFGTRYETEPFERRPLNLAVAVDVSGSMDGEKMQATREALLALVEQLDDEDQLALVEFNDAARVVRNMTEMNDSGRRRMKWDILDLQAGGGTNIEAGMNKAYGQVAPDAAVTGLEDRVMLFTDAQPNIGATDTESFLGMARYYGAAGIGISVFGLGLDLGSELATEISNVEGGNTFYLADEEAISSVFDEEFDYMVTPVAYDLEVQVTLSDEFALAESYGTPVDEDEEIVDFGVSTLFLSSQDGGMGVTLVPASEEAMEASLAEMAPERIASFHLTYSTADDNRQQIEMELDVNWEGGDAYADETALADDYGVYKMSGLVDEYLALDAGAAYCEESLSPHAARTTVQEAEVRLEAMAQYLEDADLAEEAELMAKLAGNLSTGESACWF